MKRRAFVRRMAVAALACSLLDLERLLPPDPLKRLEASTYVSDYGTEYYVHEYLQAFVEARNAHRHTQLTSITAALRGDG